MKKAFIICVVFVVFGCAARSDKTYIDKANGSFIQFNIYNGNGYAEKDGYSYIINKNNLKIKENDVELVNKNFDSEISSYTIDSSSDIIMALKSGSIRECSPATKETAIVDEFFEPIKTIKVSKDNIFIIIISENNRIALYNRITKNISMGSYKEKVVDVQTSRNSENIYIQFEDKIVILDFNEKKELKTILY